MKTHQNVLVLAGLLGVLAALNCGGDVTTPGGGGQQNDPRRCYSGFNTPWSNNGLNLDVTSPPCPFTVNSRSSQLTYAGKVTAPRQKITFDGTTVRSYVNVYAMNYYDASTIASANFVPFVQSPSDASVYRAEVNMSGVPGTFLAPGSSSQMLDSLHVDAQFMVASGIASAWKVLPGNVTSAPPIVLGPTNVAAGTGNTWRSQPDWDTTAYTFRWLVNGQEVPGATQATFATTLYPAGTYQVTNVATRTDGTGDAVTKTVSAVITASINGYHDVTEWVLAHFDASASGGGDPYTYDWYVDGGYANGGPSLNWYFGPGGTSHNVELYVTGTIGGTAYASFAVYAHSAGCPEQELCMIAPPDNQTSPNAPARRRGVDTRVKTRPR